MLEKPRLSKADELLFRETVTGIAAGIFANTGQVCNAGSRLIVDEKIRDELLAQGIQLKDGKDPETGERVTTWEVKR